MDELNLDKKVKLDIIELLVEKFDIQREDIKDVQLTRNKNVSVELSNTYKNFQNEFEKYDEEKLVYENEDGIKSTFYYLYKTDNNSYVFKCPRLNEYKL